MARTAGSHARLTGPRIEEAALRLIGRDGFAAVSMRQVAAEVGVQVGALYNYVPDKQQLLARLVFGALDAADAAWDAVPGGGDVSDEIDRLTLAHLHFVIDQPEAAALPRRELQFLSDADREEAERRIAARMDRLEEVVLSGRDAGILRVPDVGFLATALMSMVEGVARWAPGSGLPAERIERMSQHMIRRMLPRVSKQ